MHRVMSYSGRAAHAARAREPNSRPSIRRARPFSSEAARAPTVSHPYGEDRIDFMGTKKNGHFLQGAIFNDVCDHAYATQVARRYSDDGQRLADERRLAAMEEG